MREPEVVEAELVEIAALADDETRFNRIVVWCAAHPDEIPMAMHLLLGNRLKGSPPGQ
ncbi:MAG TPA: hypothetical protein VG297_24895 [Bryobacteraceae bacterium]|jgi:hypothetical protein|nr:hypothetical protein [Bryobacteraceae bacterium]